MIRNYIRIAWRNIIRQRSFAFLNIVGLAVGLAASMLILSWVQHERSYDSFHVHADQLYRITAKLDQENFKAAVSPSPLAPELKERISEVADFVRITVPRTHYFEYNDDRYEEKAVIYADTNFFEVFTFPFVAGDITAALQRPDGIVITERIAKKYFNKENPIGKVLKFDHTQQVTVTGVLADIPSHSHLQFDYVLPLTFLNKDHYLYPNDDWGHFIYYSYLRLQPHRSAMDTGLPVLEQGITEIYREHVEGSLLKTSYQLQSLKDIHLHSQNLQVELAERGNYQYVNTLFFVAIFILAVACINFMNLATARSARRAKEVGLRKVIGANRLQLILQFLGEALMIVYFSFILAIGLVWISLPLFNELANTTLDAVFFHPTFLFYAVSVATITGLVAGIYPAVYLSGFVPAKALKGVFSGTGNGNLVFRNTLVVVQFVVSITLLVGTILAYQQLNYLKNRNLGFDKSGLLYVPMVGNIWGQQQAYRNALRDNPLTANFSVTDDVPTNLRSGTIDYHFEGKEPNSSLILPTMDVDEHFLDVFDMKLVAGRSFSHQFGNDSSNYVVNETLVNIMGLSPQEALGKPFTLWDKKGMIIGVVKDFNFKPASQVIEPIVLKYNDWGGMVVVKTSSQQLVATRNALEEINTKLNPNFPFSYGFVDQDLERLYLGEQRLSNLFNFFAMLAIFVSCLGLYGLSSYIAERRAKEIGIRKIMGSSSVSIFYLLSKSFLALVAIAICIALPLSWYAGNTWLASFAYRIDVHWSIFILAAGVATTTAMVTTSYQAWKAARTKPVDSLRDE
ncbi:ABC transporter permease [Sphingobacterium sp. DN00404]|uniref:ABC transporter permease n=1 Tax=Sphingobacterium micropteri TaxID=2763501 RepID=A0ABR7YS49_9SPHI|nr:ABC transporter permease [Sphingobacterium micropteri]MBD1434159.1 ABC transporter permease [Sphingobacterium micropteri]